MTYEITFKVRPPTGDSYDRICRASPDASISDIVSLATDVCGISEADSHYVYIEVRDDRFRELIDGEFVYHD